MLSWLFRIMPRRWAAFWVGALLTNASVVLASLSVYNVTKREGVALAVAGIGELLVALTWRAFLVYTDNNTMIFLALMLWLYTTTIRPEIKIPLIILFAAIACFIKVTSVLVIVSIVINGLLGWLCSSDHKLNFKRIALYVGCFAAFFGMIFGLQGPIRSHYGYVRGQFPKGWQYLLMVGQNTEALGMAHKSNGEIRDEYMQKYDTLEEINKAFLKKAAEFIRERGFWGNLVYYENKINSVYNDGYFHNVQHAKMKKTTSLFCTTSTSEGASTIRSARLSCRFCGTRYC